MKKKKNYKQKKKRKKKIKEKRTKEKNQRTFSGWLLIRLEKLIFAYYWQRFLSVLTQNSDFRKFKKILKFEILKKYSKLLKELHDIAKKC